MSSCEPLSLDWLDEELSANHSVDQRSMNRATVQGELEKRLRCRADRDELVKKHILPDLSTSPVLYGQTQLLQRAQIADTLKKKLSTRAERNELLQLNILPDLQTTIAPKLQARQLELKKHKLADSLNEKLANRPGPLELVREGILEPKNNALAAMVQSVEGNSELSGAEGGGPSSTCGFSDNEFLSPPEAQKINDSSSPTPSPREGSVEATSPIKSLTSPPTFPGPYPLTRIQPQGNTQQHISQLVNLGTSAIGKAMSPSVVRKKQQKQQKYRKLRYHEYIPPSKNNGKGGKTNPKTHTSSKPESPYSMLLQQQQLFLQLQVLQQQYPNGVLMQKLPDILKGIKQDVTVGKDGAKLQASPSGAEKSGSSSTQNLPQTVQVEQPNPLNATSIRFDELKVSDLKTACKELRLIVSGKKAELVERLLEHNNGYLPACALPDCQSRDVRKHSGVPSAASYDSQASAPSPMSPTLASPIFKFPHVGGVSSASVVDCLSSISPLGGPVAQVFPASNFQQQFDEIVERQKRSYISQKAPKSIAPRPELNDMVAIRFPCIEQRGRGVAPSGGREVKPQVANTQASKSLPTSPKNLSPTDSTQSLLNELMENSSGSVKPSGDAPTVSQPSSLQSTHFTESLSFTTSSLSVVPSPLPHSGYVHHQQQNQQQQRTHRASVPAMQNIQPLRYDQALMQRSLSTTGMSLSQLGTSSSTISSTISYPSLPEMGSCGTGDLSKSMSPDILLGHEDPMPGGDLMEIETADQPLADILDIFPSGSNEFGAQQPHSLGYDNKVLRVDGPSSDNIMLSSHPLQPFGNTLNHQSRSTSDLCLRDTSKSNLGSAGNYGNNHMVSSEFGWLDLTLDNMGTFGLSPSPPIGTAAAMSHSNPNSLMQDSYMYFMDDSSVHPKSSNHPNGVSAHHDATTFLEPILNPASHFFATSEEAALLELGLSTS